MENYKLLEELQMHETQISRSQKEQNAAQKVTSAQEQEV